MTDNNNRPGTVFKDILPIPVPSDTTATTDPAKEEEAAPTLRDEPTLSHALAMAGDAEPEAVTVVNGEAVPPTEATKGAAQREHDAEVVNLGWHEPKREIAEPLVGGMDNEELWLLVRRFNKQIYHVKQYDRQVPGNLDLNIADEEEFSPDKLRANVERLYMTVVSVARIIACFYFPADLTKLITADHWYSRSRETGGEVEELEGDKEDGVVLHCKCDSKAASCRVSLE